MKHNHDFDCILIPINLPCVKQNSQKSSESDEEPDVEYAGEGGLREDNGRGRRRARGEGGSTEDTTVTDEEEDNKNKKRLGSLIACI